MNSLNSVGSAIGTQHICGGLLQQRNKLLFPPGSSSRANSAKFLFQFNNFSSLPSRTNYVRTTVQRRISYCMSVDVEKGKGSSSFSVSVDSDTPAISEDPTENALPNAANDPRLEEKFAVLNTGQYECRSCGYVYDQAVGDPFYPISPGLDFSQLPEDWRCPTCGASQSFFSSKSVEIAGFAQNQKYGLGGNTLTSNQKSILIYGTLLFFFVLFLLGYFVQ